MYCIYQANLEFYVYCIYQARP